MLKTLSLLLVLLSAFYCGAQDLHNIPYGGDSTRVWRIETNDDNEFIGKILGVEAGIMTVQTEKFGVLNIKMIDIKSIEEASPSKVIDGTYWADNFQSTRYFWMPNGFGLKPGEAYYQNVWILFNQFSVGITKNISIGAGTIPIFLFGANEFPFWITPKVSIPISEKFNFGAGVLYARLFDTFDDEPGGGGVAYGVFTFGTRNKNASLGVGYGFSGRTFSRRPVITFATMSRVSRKGYFMTESYLFASGDGDGEAFGIVSLGGRRLIKRVGLDFGGFFPIVEGMDRLIIIPWLGVSMPLGKQHLED